MNFAKSADQIHFAYWMSGEIYLKSGNYNVWHFFARWNWPTVYLKFQFRLFLHNNRYIGRWNWPTKLTYVPFSTSVWLIFRKQVPLFEVLFKTKTLSIISFFFTSRYWDIAWAAKFNFMLDVFLLFLKARVTKEIPSQEMSYNQDTNLSIHFVLARRNWLAKLIYVYFAFREIMSWNSLLTDTALHE